MINPEDFVIIPPEIIQDIFQIPPVEKKDEFEDMIKNLPEEKRKRIIPIKEHILQ